MNLDGLNEAQREAVLKTEGPVMILAGAGSGKTKTLVTRIAYLLEEIHVSPFQVLALTFSNKAAREMRERISSMVQADIGALQITTFHSFCARILRTEANYLGLSKNFTIYDTSEQKAVVKAILGRHGISTKELSPFEILYYMDDLKNHGHYNGRDLSEADYEIDESHSFYTYYQQYEAELHKANAVDFGSLITGVIQLFEKFPEVLKRYQDRFKYLLVDEYQDTNRAQFDLVKMLSENNRNICVVGDEDQSIYSWRGADIRNILDFEEVFSDAKILKLEQNYRSSKNIIEAATCVIARNSQRKGKEMWTNNPHGEDIEVIECFNDKDEADYIAKEILKLSKNGSPFKEMAVFYRTNTQSRLIEDYLRKSNIPYRVVGGVKFYERKEIKDLLAYIRIVVNDKDSLALSRIINVPARGIGATSLRKLETEAVDKNCSLWDILDEVVTNPSDFKHIRLSAKVKSALNHLVTLINDVRTSSDSVAPSSLYERILHESGYYDFLKSSKDYESIARMENLEELGNAIVQFEQSNEGATLLNFLETITLDTTQESDNPENTGEVSLMTIHGAKGLEFHNVFLCGAEENVFPSYKSLENGDTAIEEERRLFYVAMTRAMEKLHITFAQGRMLFGQLRFNGPSRFINEIPEKFYQWKKPNGGTRKTGDSWDSGSSSWDDDFNQDSSYDDEPVYQTASIDKVIDAPKPKFPKGVKVIHSLYGAGTVLDSDGFGKEEKVSIKFSDGARKKFLVKFAPLVLA
ncbi:ATP-dependent helicase [Halobacteriovorax sp. HLS]|uniref:ATP-dependent helicase n=1 Tax=Halobacteriovorax sp. HLS TaxID=2234000 RepID=UPI000FD9C801|nr:UvrD-helicase domain-containing protein [Halobacteriovorax sp. HLS]